MRCALIPAADVALGSNQPDAEADERPLHRASLSQFLIDVEPVSTTAYCRFLNSLCPLPDNVLKDWFILPASDKRECHSPIERRFRRWRPIKGTERRPMMLVSWYGANAYSLWANRRDWRTYRGDGKFVEGLHDHASTVPPAASLIFDSSLPTEAQWEYAAHGAEPRRFPWGDEPPTPELACIERHSRGDEYSADAIPSADVNEPLGLSPFGLHHMAGNVWQWCRDWYAPDFYQTQSSVGLDPMNMTPTGIRSERGGSWVGPAHLARTTYRRGRAPEARGRCLGFRCVGHPTDLPFANQ
jgi:formylglycine-generating enzyme required for sulfatase activity